MCGKVLKERGSPKDGKERANVISDNLIIEGGTVQIRKIC
jgi:hypothetical protein